MAMVQNNKKWVGTLSTAVNLGSSVAAAIAVGLFGGRWLDNKFNTGYLFTIIGFILGVLSSGKMMWEKLMADSRPKAYKDTRDQRKGK